ncbi:hypothetical protein [Xanthomonas theicola]|uniref:hypothetical protein n=1 Tax=Xanthomonas theicola TaxID=56464 RepID=UPI00163B5462|nr:hypothetical protein [Xanthomonas theicola]QNH24005.1 hypothetical protein G4Q83_03455 [Xanthomonas theicola]
MAATQRAPAAAEGCKKILRSFAHLLLCDAGTAHAAKSFFQLADRLARQRRAVLTTPRASARHALHRQPVAEKRGNSRCFSLCARFAAGLSAAVADRRARPDAVLGALGTRDVGKKIARKC